MQDLADLGPDGVPRIELLWEWQSPLTQGIQVSCMAWNRKQSDLLAVGYGNNAFQAGADASAPTVGLVAFWSLKNPGHPLWSFETKSGITAIDFATHSPNILAVGMYDGTVAIFDVKSRHGSPAMESDAATGRHTDPVWKVRAGGRGGWPQSPPFSPHRRLTTVLPPSPSLLRESSWLTTLPPLFLLRSSGWTAVRSAMSHLFRSQRTGGSLSGPSPRG